MTSGQSPIPPFQADCPNWLACLAAEEARADGGRNVADQIEDAGLTWGAYMEGMVGPDGQPAPCVHPAATDVTDGFQKGYATRHDPFVYYPSIVGTAVVGSAARCQAHVRPYGDLTVALPSGDVPNYSFIVPDTCDDGHDAPCADGRAGGLVTADAWLQTNVPAILASPAYQDRGALFITFDEGANSDEGGCCTTGVEAMGFDGGGNVGLLMLSPLGKVGHATDVTYDHNSLLRTVEDGFDIAEHLNNAGSTMEHPMADLFAAKKSCPCP